jgi:hypothetical protein
MKIKKRQLEGPGINGAKAKVKDAEGRLRIATSLYEFLEPKKKAKNSVVTTREWEDANGGLMEAQAAVDAAKAELDQAHIAVENAAQDITVAEEQMKSTKSALVDAEQRLTDTTVYSPINGMILKKHVQKGEVVSSAQTTFTGGTPIMDIADVSEIYADVNVDEADIGQVHELAPSSARPGETGAQLATQPASAQAASTQPASGQPGLTKSASTQPELPPGTIDEGRKVEVTVETLPDEKFYGVITRISPRSESSGGVATFQARIKITSSNWRKLIGLLNAQAEAHFTAKSVRNAVLVKYDAVQKNPNGDDYGVFVPVTKPGAERPEPKFVPCKFGANNGIDIQVTSGIEAGQKVYTKLPQKTDREEREESKKKQS